MVEFSPVRQAKVCQLWTYRLEFLTLYGAAELEKGVDNVGTTGHLDVGGVAENCILQVKSMSLLVVHSDRHTLPVDEVVHFKKPLCNLTDAFLLCGSYKFGKMQCILRKG